MTGKEWNMEQKFTGLTTEEVNLRKQQGKTNQKDESSTRTVKQIILGNTITFFNIINVILLIMVLTVLSFKNTLFIFIIIINTGIGIIQELRAKKTLDNLAILTASQATVIRDGVKQQIPVEEIVLDDAIILSQGNQIPSDSVVLSGHLEVNESLLTGESDAIPKDVGGQLYSGSFVTAGKAVCQVVKVGKDNYMEQITKEAKTYKRHNSELKKSINQILKVISIIIVPIGIAMFCKQYYFGGESYKTAILATVAALLGMIPEGLVLLTSLSLTLGVLKLAKQKTLVQELYCIETLARVDVLCLDKTGTLTEGRIEVEQVLTPPRVNENQLGHALANMVYALKDDNVTFMALKEHFGEAQDMKPVHVIPFSSDRKYSGVAFEGSGTFIMGAVQFLFPEGEEELKAKCQIYAAKGYRIIVVAHTDTVSYEDGLPAGLTPCGIVLMTDVLRKDVNTTLSFFAKQGVCCKVISGDDPVTVSAIAAKAGMAGADAYVDATTLETDADIEEAVAKYNVFGRVTPKQKKQMVVALHKQGHTVAMTGDGVNDVLALKEADCSIAMASGSEAAKNTANLVLLDSNFNAMPHILNEGRRVINNISMAASMFLIKTVFSVLLALETIIIGQTYPFAPIQLSIINGCAVGIPTFLLAKEPNYQKINPKFLRTVMKSAFPTGATISIILLAVNHLGTWLNCTPNMISTVGVLVTGWLYMHTLKELYSPMTAYRKLIVYSMQILYLACMVIGQKLLELVGLDFNAVILMVACIYFGPMLKDLFDNIYDAWVRRRERKERVLQPNHTLAIDAINEKEEQIKQMIKP
jgi:cation-transporting ATPase E